MSTPAQRRPGLRRSVALLRAFRLEQSDPAAFYRMLARDSVELVQEHEAVRGRVVLDVGGGPGYFAEAFRCAGARYMSLESDAGELSTLGRPPSNSVQGSALALPVGDASVDVCFSSNVLEHVPDPRAMLEEMVRVTRPGGCAVVSFTAWFGPWGGHETAPWHYLGGGFARRRYVRRHQREPKNRYGESMFAVRVGPAIRWASALPGSRLEAVFPRYHPWWARWVVRVPVLRELVTWNLVLVLRRTRDSE